MNTLTGNSTLNRQEIIQENQIRSSTEQTLYVQCQYAISERDLIYRENSELKALIEKLQGEVNELKAKINHKFNSKSNNLSS